MNQSNQHLEDIKVIKKIMEESSRFLSLSGLSGIFAGIFAIAGAIVAKMIIDSWSLVTDWYSEPFVSDYGALRNILPLIVNMAVVLFLAIAASVFFSSRKARKSGLNVWTPVTRRMLVSLIVPLVTGGLFIILTISIVPASVILAATLIFYGISLVSAGKFTFGEIHWLGVLEIITGMLCILLPAWSLMLWALGFGAIHSVYGLFMHLRYKG
jgi:hypothetical protein